jgi:hypothetical protein
VALDEASLQRDLQDAMRARDRQRIDVLRGLIAAIKNLKVERQIPQLPEADIVGLVRKELNKRQEIIGFAQQAGRAETVAQGEAEKAFSLPTCCPADAASLSGHPGHRRRARHTQIGAETERAPRRPVRSSWRASR